MAVNYSTVVKTNRLQNVVDAIASKTYVVGSGAGSAGSLVIGTSALSGATGVLATIALPNPPAVASGTTLTISGVPISVTASATGTAALAELRNNAGTVIVSGLTVGTSATDIIISTTSITSGQTVQLTSGVITHG
jgi:hypothetical protein